MQVTYQTIINEINQIPVVFLEDLYSIIHSFNTGKFQKAQNRTKILELAGSWADMPVEDFDDMMNEINSTKNEMFNRTIEL